MSYPENDLLRTLKHVNNLRRHEAFAAGGGFSEVYFGCALAGEAGELCNLIKKRARGMEGDAEAAPVSEVAKEAADVLIYLDLLATKVGFDLRQAVIDKFNEVSIRRGSKYRLRNDGDYSIEQPSDSVPA